MKISNQSGRSLETRPLHPQGRSSASRTAALLAVLTVSAGLLVSAPLPARAEPQHSINGCTILNTPNSPEARDCVDNGNTLKCTSTGTYCCEITASGDTGACDLLSVAYYVPPRVTPPAQDELPPRSLVTPIVGGATPPSGLKVIGAGAP